jgi:sulfur-oxidizing protein SoxX
MRKALLFLALAALAMALAQRYFTEEELKLIQTGGKAYAEVFVNQRPDQALCSIHRNRLPADLLPKFLEEQRALIKYPADGKLMGDWRKGGEIFNDLRRRPTASPATMAPPCTWEETWGPAWRSTA